MTECFTEREWQYIWAEFDDWYNAGEVPDWPEQMKKIQELIDTALKDR